MEEYSKIMDFVKKELAFDNSGHGYQHALRVFRNAQKILKDEGGNPKIVLTASLIHDTIDKKLFTNVDERVEYVKEFLKNNGYHSAEIDDIVYIITNISWSKGDNKELNGRDAKIVRDADRLEAMGAIGVVRAIEFGASRNMAFYEDDNLAQSSGKYAFNKVTQTTISHFYEKLLKLKDLLHTETAKNMAQKRHEFMLAFLAEFYEEL